MRNELMTSERLPDFLAMARDWRAIADELRARGVSEDPALGVWREAAWCHLLFTSGKFALAVARLRVVVRDVVGRPPASAHPPSNHDEALAAASDLFAQIRAAVTARHPSAFGRPVAA
jgi:hypothetical protein